MHPEGGVPIKGSVIATPFPSAMQFQQARNDVSFGGLGFKDRFVKTVNKSFSVITDGTNWLAVDDNALLQKLQLRERSVLPSKPKSKILVDVFGFIYSSLQCHDYVWH